MTIVDWVDVFSRQCYRDIVIESLNHCQVRKGLRIYAYVIMSNHVHLVAHTEGYELSHVLRDFKKFTANQMLKAIQEDIIFNVSYGVNPFIISALCECPPPSRPPVRDKIGSEKDLWSEQISKIAKRFLRFARSSLVFGGEAAELEPEFTLSLQ